MRLLITNAYSAHNRGDAAIVLGMLRELRARPAFRDAAIVIASSDPDFDRGSYAVPVLPSLRALCARCAPGPLLPELLFALVVLPASVGWALAQRFARVDVWLPAGLRQILRAYRDVDLIVAAGGGYLYTTSVWKGNCVLVATVFGFLLGRLLGRPVVLYAQSVGPFAGAAQAWLVRQALCRVQLVQVRERRSLALLEGWRLPTPPVLATDAALLVEAEAPGDLGIPEGDAALVGVTVRRWFRNEGAQRRYENALAEFLDALIERGLEVVLVPQVTHAGAGDDDRVVGRRIVARLRRATQARLLEVELRPGQIKGLCGRMRWFVGTRMHSNIFALSMGVPTLAIGYLPKTAGLMETLGLEEWTLPIETLTAHRLEEAFARLVAREQEVRGRLAQRIPELTRAAMDNGRTIEEALSRWRGSRGEA